VGWAPAKWSEVRNDLWSVNWKGSHQPFVRGSKVIGSSVGLVGRRCDNSDALLTLARTMQPCVNSSSYSDLWHCVFFLDGSGKDGAELHALAHTYTASGQGPEGLGMDGANRHTSLNDPIWMVIHSNMQRLHDAWVRTTGVHLATDKDPCGGYQNLGEELRVGHELRSPFVPKVHVFGTAEGESPFTVCSQTRDPERVPWVYDSYEFAPLPAEFVPA